MVKIDFEKIVSLQHQATQVRNLSVIAHVDHGKTTLTDGLLKEAGVVAAIGKGGTYTMQMEKDRGITIKSTGVSLFVELPEYVKVPKGSKSSTFLINLIDSPGHVDFSSEVTSALRLTDGSLVVVDCVEGTAVQTETVLRQSLQERVRPVLVVNKLDRAINELQLDEERCYQQLEKVISSVNTLITTYSDPNLPDWTLNPVLGNICFTSAKQGWGFTLFDFARMYAGRFGISVEEMLTKLWGDNYWDPIAKKWSVTGVDSKGEKLPRAFCQYVMEPILKLFSSSKQESPQQFHELVAKLSKNSAPLLSEKEKQLEVKEQLKLVMSRWIPSTRALTEMIAVHLPSPVEAQKYRTEVLYSGPQDDLTARAMKECDPKGPLLVYVSKMFPVPNTTKFYAFGRVYSGTITTGKKLRIMGGSYSPSQPTNTEELFVDVSVQRVCTVMTSHPEPVESIPAGNTVALVGIDKYLNKSGTVVELAESWPLHNLKHANAPVLRVAVAPKRSSDLTKLVEAMKRLSRSDPLVVCTVADTGEHIVGCAGELHLSVCLTVLREYMGDSEIVVSAPVVPCKETVVAKSSVTCLGKSPNGHNRLYAVASPLNSELLTVLAPGSNSIVTSLDVKARARVLVEQYGWDETSARKIWSFSPPEEDHANILCEVTKGIQYMNEIKDSVVSAFHWAVREGVLASEPLRGVKFEITDALLHADAIHRGAGQILPTGKRLFQAAQLSAEPKLMEPLFLTEIATVQKGLSGIFVVLGKRRAKIIETVAKGVGSAYIVRAHLPVLESFGLTDDLRQETGGMAFPQCTFSHYEIVPQVLAADLVKKIRERKGMTPDVPAFDKLNDRL